jgi:hypothetical protein
MYENRETSRLAVRSQNERIVRWVKAKSRTTHVHDLEESDSAVVPMKSPNKVRGLDGGSAAEVMEGRVGAKENCK